MSNETAEVPADAQSVEAHTGGYVAGLDALRAVAALWVFTFHLASLGVDFGPFQDLANGGDVGVIIFFVLSGYLLYAPFVRGNVEWRGYLVRRLLRLVPAYVLALVGLSLISGDRSFTDSPATYLLFLQNFDPHLFQNFIGPAWTLQLEMTFCLLLPIIAIVLARMARGDVRRPATVLIVAAAVSIIGGFAGVVAIGGGPHSLWLVSMFPFMFWAFVPGMILALVAGRRPDALRRLGSRPLLVVGIAMVVVSGPADISYANLLAAVGTMLVVAGVVVQRPSGRLLKGFAVAGATLSYPFYLWHVDLIRFFVAHGLSGTGLAAVAFVAVVLISAVSYLVVERPAMRFARRVSARIADPSHRAEHHTPAIASPSPFEPRVAGS